MLSSLLLKEILQIFWLKEELTLRLGDPFVSPIHEFIEEGESKTYK